MERDQKLLICPRSSNNVKLRFKKLSPLVGNEALVRSMRHSSPSFSIKSLICHVAHQSNESFSSTVVERAIFCHQKINFFISRFFIPGLGTDFQEITSNIILLGDHKQLGPVISSEIAARLGLSENH